ncbi:YfgM family protein [Marinomonas epiphytica]
MSELKTEEEQIEAFKTWWKKNGTALIITVAVAVGGYFGFQAWQTSKANHVAEASDLYQNMVQASADLTNEDNQKTVSFIAQQLNDDYSDTGYAMFAKLFVARLDAEQGNYDQAVGALKEAAAQTEDESFRAIAQLRIAQLLLQQEKFSESLAQLETVTASEFVAQKQELMGDIYLQQGKRDQAREAYQTAKNALVGGTNHPLLEIKLQDLVKG